MSQECARCILTDEVPGVAIGADGTCSVCKGHDARHGDWPKIRARRAAEFEGLLRAARGAGRTYDALVPLSGGKDSMYVLYLARRVYGLRTLAVTYDNAFLTPHARKNITRALDILGSDHIMVRLGGPLQKALYRQFFLKTGFFCPACMSGINYAIETAAASHRVPIVLSGTSRRTEEHVAPEFFVPSSPDFYRAVVEDDPLRTQSPIRLSMPLGRRLVNKLPLPLQVRFYWGTGVNVPDYLDWDYDVIFETIQRELGWEAHAPDAEHSDCSVDPAVNYIRQRKYPAVVPELTRFSKLVTLGTITKDEARKKVAAARAQTQGEPAALTTLLQSLDISREQFEAVIADRGRHMPYLARHYGVRARVRKVVGALPLVRSALGSRK